MKKFGVFYVNEQSTEVRDKDACVFGICWMLGIGKITIAKAVYKWIHHLFQGCSFLSNIVKMSTHEPTRTINLKPPKARM